MADEQELTAVKNTVTIEDAGPCKKKVVVEVPAEAIKQATDRQYESLRREAFVPGFRPGRAPRRLLEKRYGKETLEQVKLKLLADASESAIKDNKLDVLREPDIDFEKIELPAEGPLQFDFELEVRPRFELPKLEGIAVKKQKLEVTAEQVDREIEQMRKYSGLWAPKDGCVEADDQVIADVVLKTEDAEPQKLDSVEIFVRSGGFVAAVPVENLDTLLVGASSGDVKKTTVNVPKTYFRQEYRGKKVDVEITIREIKFLKPAELDKAFLANLGAESIEQLREQLQDRLHWRLENQIRSEMTEQIYEYLLKNTDFDLPADIIAEQADTVLKRQYVNLLRQGLSKERIEQQMDQLRSASEQQAERQLKTFFIMEKAAEKFEIEVTEEELNGLIAQLAIQQGQRPERLKAQLSSDGSLAQLRLQARDDKTIAKLLESAKITEAEPPKPSKKATKTSAKSKKKTVKNKAKKTDAPKVKQAKKNKSTAKKKTVG